MSNLTRHTFHKAIKPRMQTENLANNSFSINYSLWIWKKCECVLIWASHVNSINIHLKMVMSLTVRLLVGILLSCFKKDVFLRFFSHVYLQPHQCLLNRFFFTKALIFTSLAAFVPVAFDFAPLPVVEITCKKKEITICHSATF